MTGLALLLAALLWRRIRWRQARRVPADLHAGLEQLLQARTPAPAGEAAAAAAPQPAPHAQDGLPFDQARLDAMFGYDRRLQGEILALFVSETRDRLAGIGHALRCERAAPARVLAQEILDGSHAMALMPLQALARQAVHAGFSNDIVALRRLHADLLMALDALSQARGAGGRLQRHREHVMSAAIDLAALRGGAILPSPAWRRQRLATLCQQQVSFDELAEQIRCDPALAGKLIGLANGAVPSGGRLHAAVSAAMLAALGRPALIQALAAPAAASTLCAQFNEPRFWCHALAMACAARLAGDALQLAPADDLFTCGQLANTGQL
eukprot:gene28511-34624_t